jgi:hypothetical protein
VSGGYVIAEEGAGGLVHVAASHVFNPATGSWAATSAVGAYGRAGTVLRDGRVVLAGGQLLAWDGSQQVTFQTTVSLYTPSSGAWTSLSALPVARAGFTLAELPNGMLLAAGGRVPDGGSASGVTSRSAHAYDWGPKLWRTAPSLDEARAGQGSLLLGDGRVLVVGGETASTETYIVGDLIPPSASTPTTVLRSGVKFASSGIPIRINLGASDTGGSGFGTYDVGRSVGGGAYETVATTVTGSSYDAFIGTGQTYRFQVRPRDWAGNAGAWKAGVTVLLKLFQESSGVSYSGLWKRLTVGGYSGGAVRYNKSAGASATFTFTGRGVSFVTTKGPTLGKAKIYIDGSYVTTVNLYSSTWQYRFVAFQKTWSSNGTHRIKVVNVGTYGHPRVDIDGFVVLTTP